MSTRDLEKEIQKITVEMIPNEVVEDLVPPVKNILRDYELSYTINTLRAMAAGIKLHANLQRLSAERPDKSRFGDNLAFALLFRLIAKLEADNTPQ